jgi:DNA repair protein RadC
MLDKDHRVLGIEEVSIGSATAAMVHPREVFKGLILANADAFVAVHSHLGDATPSREDLDITQELKAAADLLGIRFLDHVIIGRNRYVSFGDDGYW